MSNYDSRSLAKIPPSNFFQIIREICIERSECISWEFSTAIQEIVDLVSKNFLLNMINFSSLHISNPFQESQIKISFEITTLTVDPLPKEDKDIICQKLAIALAMYIRDKFLGMIRNCIQHRKFSRN